jgi:hypothetical protein
VFLLSTTEERALRDIARLAEHKKPKPALPPSPALDGSSSNRTTSRMMSSMHGSESSLGDCEPRCGKTAKRLQAKGESIAAFRMRSP